MEPEKLLEYLGYEVEENGRLVVIYKTMDEWERERDTKFHYYYDEKTGILYGDYPVEKVLLPIGKATTVEKAVLIARWELERLFRDRAYNMQQSRRVTELMYRKDKEGVWRRQQYICYSPEEEERILQEQAKILAQQDKKAGMGGEGGD